MRLFRASRTGFSLWRSLFRRVSDGVEGGWFCPESPFFFWPSFARAGEVSPVLPVSFRCQIAVFGVIDVSIDTSMTPKTAI